ncbi:predicted protein [Histoplasma capsulatum H143]|uniref:Uncharacterized protein n=1 Tax=Ajellomyces capsulatus (strain H143) TaxID=544712 RepID=C6HD12_AJECH|nr:predicted protein [Histoplasma capsulatum H143]
MQESFLFANGRILGPSTPPAGHSVANAAIQEGQRSQRTHSQVKARRWGYILMTKSQLLEHFESRIFLSARTAIPKGACFGLADRLQSGRRPVVYYSEFNGFRVAKLDILQGASSYVLSLLPPTSEDEATGLAPEQLVDEPVPFRDGTE